MRTRTLTRWLLSGCLVLAAPTLAACGSSKKKTTSAVKSPTATAGTIPLSITESGTTAKYTVPTSVAGGLVTLQLANQGKMPHFAQLIRFDAPHTVAQVGQALGGNSKKTPSWIHYEGGLGGVAPGQTGRAIVNLPAGTYLVADIGGGPSAPNTQPAVAQFTVTSGKAGSVPASATTITAANPSKDHYKWQITGPLRSGVNNITFNSKGAQAVHQITAVRVTGNPSKATIIKALNSNGPPPPFVDRSTISNTAVIDGNKSQTTPLPLVKPGTYILFCHFTDRDGGKFHYQEGLLTTITVR